MHLKELILQVWYGMEIISGIAITAPIMILICSTRLIYSVQGRLK